MLIQFVKYQGTGNDFILVDNRSSLPIDKESVALKWCDRHFGIGSDGLIFIENSDTADFKMDFLNPDGSRSFCGNGSRCAVAFFLELTGKTGPVSFEAVDGLHEGHRDGDVISVRMRDTAAFSINPFGWFIHTGSPHQLVPVDNPNDIDLKSGGGQIRYNRRFAPGGTNVNFVKIENELVRIRTYERGVENETLSCGTGVTAAGLWGHHFGGLASPVRVLTRGGELSVSFRKSNDGFTDISLRGPAVRVFSGQIQM
jgi:diaminopimelate epimerase